MTMRLRVFSRARLGRFRKLSKSADLRDEIHKRGASRLTRESSEGREAIEPMVDQQRLHKRYFLDACGQVDTNSHVVSHGQGPILNELHDIKWTYSSTGLVHSPPSSCLYQHCTHFR